MRFMSKTLLTDGEIADYAGQVALLDETDLVDETRRQIHDAGYETRHSPSDQRCTVCYQEAVRRGKVHLYQRGYNTAALDVGMSVSFEDLDKARAPLAMAA